MLELSNQDMEDVMKARGPVSDDVAMKLDDVYGPQAVATGNTNTTRARLRGILGTHGLSLKSRQRRSDGERARVWWLDTTP